MNEQVQKSRRRLRGATARLMTVAALVALLATFAPWPAGVRPAGAHDTCKHVVCQESIVEGSAGQMQVQWKHHEEGSGGGFHDGDGNDAGLSHAALAADGGQWVDTSPPQG